MAGRAAALRDVCGALNAATDDGDRVVVGVLMGTSYLVAEQAIGDWLTALIAIASLAVITMGKKVPNRS